jgi:hypothetical protein
MSKPSFKNRIAPFFLEASSGNGNGSSIPPSSIEEDKETSLFFEDLNLDPEYLEPDDGDDDWDDGDDDDDDDDDEEFDLDPETEDKLEVAVDTDSVMAEARMIFRRDPKTGHLLMIARIEDDEFVDEDFDDSGDEMWEGEVIVRLTAGFSGAKKIVQMPRASLFRKGNWEDELCE